MTTAKLSTKVAFVGNFNNLSGMFSVDFYYNLDLFLIIFSALVGVDSSTIKAIP